MFPSASLRRLRKFAPQPRAKISLSACSNTKYFQRPAPSHLSKNASGLPGIGHGALAEFERSLIRERTQAGLAAARRIGRTGGRPPKLTDDDIGCEGDARQSP